MTWCCTPSQPLRLYQGDSEEEKGGLETIQWGVMGQQRNCQPICFTLHRLGSQTNRQSSWKTSYCQSQKTVPELHRAASITSQQQQPQQ